MLRISDAGDHLWRESCILFNKPIEFLIDTGSQVTLVPSTHIKGLGAQVATNLDVDVRATEVPRFRFPELSIMPLFCGENKVTLGESWLPRMIENLSWVLIFCHILVSLLCNIVLLSAVSIIISSASFHLKSSAIMDSMRFPARPLPFSMRIMVESELQRLLQRDVINSVDNPTIAIPIVPVRKQVGASNPIRLCGDYSCTLNKIIDPDSYRIPTLEDILAKVSGAKVYSVIDL